MRERTHRSQHFFSLVIGIIALGSTLANAEEIITTVAGNGSRGFAGDGGPAVNAQLDITHFTGGIAADAAGNVYIADTGNHRIRKIDPSGKISTVAGNGVARFSGDGGLATSASLFAPTGLGIDTAGNLYVVDTGNQRIRRIGPDGIITTVAGNGVGGFHGDGGPATSASLSLGNVQYLGLGGYPTNVAGDGFGNLYIPDTNNGRIRKVYQSGIITTFVAGLSDPYSVAVDAVGNLIIADSSHDLILRASPNGATTVIAANLYSPSGVAIDRAGNLFIADSHSHRIRKVQPNGVTSVTAGSGDPIFDPIEGYYFVGGFSGDGGPATNALLNFPWGVAVDAMGNTYIADSLNNRIRKLSAASTDAQTAVWSFAGSLNVVRSSHTATMLQNGKVLVAGGDGGSAELYDPNTDTWTVTGNLNTPRFSHTATLLQNGKVLVAGGCFLRSSELYDPATGTWTVTGSLNEARCWHTATLLPNGKVLVTGGSPSLFNASSSAELYDPNTGIWSFTSSLSNQRFGHTATLLPSGQVLVAGGGTDDGVNDIAELYDPATEVWTTTGSLATPRANHTATLLPNGKVLVAGGLTFSGSGFAPTGTVELYDSNTGHWSITGSLNTGRQFHTATLLPDSKVLVTGGDSGNTSPKSLNSCEVYDTSRETWSLTSSLNIGRYWHSATLLSNGKVLAAGGVSVPGTTLSSAELYGSTSPNPIDDARSFVRQHYLDFLDREPDQAGWDYWVNRITECGSDARCIHERRIGVSAAFFIEMEFQDTGYFVYRFYKASFGRQPNYQEFSADRSTVIGGPNLEASKQAFADAWVQRPAFLAAYPITLSNAEVVNKLFDSAGLTSSLYDPLRQQEISAMNAGRTRALVLRDVIEISDFKNPPNPNDPRYVEIKQVSQYNPAFVLMQYFGYLRRNIDLNGYNFWLDVVNNREPNNYHAMVCAFITSSEYQLRFGSTVTRTNADCGQ